MRVYVGIVAAFLWGCGDDSVGGPADARPPDVLQHDAPPIDAPMIDAPVIDAPVIDAPMIDAPMPDAQMADAMIDAAPDAPSPERPCPDAATPVLDWSRAYGESYFDTPYGVASDSAGNAVLTGAFYNTINFGGSPLVDNNIAADDIFVVKLDPSGAHVWSLRAGGQNSFDYGSAIATDAQNNVLVAGNTGTGADFGGGPVTTTGTNNLFLAKLGPTGSHIWSKGFTITPQSGTTLVNEILAVATDSTGRVAIVGHFQGTVNFGGGSIVSSGVGLSEHDVMVAVYDSSGTYLWGGHYGGFDFDSATGAAFDSAGNLIVAGYFPNTIDFGLGALNTNNGLDDIFVVKFSPTGTPLWNHRYGSGAVVQRATTVAVDATGNIALAGDFGGTIDFGGGTPIMGTPGNFDVFLAGLDGSGAYRFAERFGDANEQHAIAVRYAPSGHIVLTGYFRGAIDFGPCHYVGDANTPRLYAAEFDAGGVPIASLVVAGSNEVMPRALAITPSGATLLTGTFDGAFDAGGGLLTSAGQSDIFVLRYSSL
jgi:hypothetical protein